MKLTYFLRCIIACFIYKATQKILYILCAMLQNGWKSIFNSVPWIITFSNKVEKCLSIRFVSLFVCPSVCAGSNSLKYPSNILKLIHAIHILYRMNRIDNYMQWLKSSSTKTQKFFYRL